MRSQPPLFSTRSRKRSSILERFLTIFRLSTTSIPTFGRPSVFYFCVKTVIGHLYSFWRCILLNCDVGKFGSGTQPCAFAWNVATAIYTTLVVQKKKKSWISVSSWIILGLSRVGWLVVWSYICFLSNTVFLQWKLWDVIRLNRRRWRIYVQIRHTYRPVSYVLRSASIFVKQGVLFIVTITYYFFLSVSCWSVVYRGQKDSLIKVSLKIDILCPGIARTQPCRFSIQLTGSG